MVRWIVIVLVGAACTGAGDPAEKTPDDSGTSSSSTGSSSTSPTTGTTASCEGTTVFALVDGVELDSGLCETDGIIHRPSQREVGPAHSGDCPTTGSVGDCSVDGDCTGSPHGRCSLVCSDIDRCACTYGCTSDVDCAADEYCEVLDRGDNGCMPAGCHIDADCVGGELCRRAFDLTVASFDDEYTLQCTSSDDTCNEMTGMECAWDGERFVAVSSTTSGCE